MHFSYNIIIFISGTKGIRKKAIRNGRRN